MRNTLPTFLRASMVATPLLISPMLQAESAIRSYDIAPQSLAHALLQFSETSGIKVFFSTELAQGLKSGGLQGSFSPEQALQKLLNGSGLQCLFRAKTTLQQGRQQFRRRRPL